MDTQTVLNILVIIEAILLLAISIILFKKTSDFKKLKKYEKALIDYQSKQDDVIPMLVHELRAPLSVIKGAMDLLIEDPNEMGADQVHKLLAQVRLSSEELLKMVGDILDVSKLEEGQFQISKSFGSISDVLKEQCGYFESMCNVKNISLSCSTGSEIPNFSFDPLRIKQVLNNLLSNAIKFTDKGGSIKVTAEEKKGNAEIAVVDTGVGVPKDQQHRLFQKFFQANNQSNISQKGTGLGLVITKGVVEAHGGTIRFEENSPKGSKFIFTLPLK